MARRETAGPLVFVPGQLRDKLLSLEAEMCYDTIEA
jgi:hypothetical protein